MLAVHVQRKMWRDPFTGGAPTWRLLDRYELSDGRQFDQMYHCETKAQAESIPIRPVVRYHVRYARNAKGAYRYHRAVAPVVRPFTERRVS